MGKRGASSQAEALEEGRGIEVKGFMPDPHGPR